MRYTDFPLPTAGLQNKISVLGFGGAPLLGRTGRKPSLAALHAAHEGGINFFDTARSYGYGESEGLLGEFMLGRRDSIVLCTKFGILPAAKSWKNTVKPLAQAVVGLVPQLRRFAQRQAAGQFVPKQFSVANLRSSFETSLRELRTDYVDMLLIHGAEPDVLGNSALLDELQRLVESGKVRMAGISGPHGTITATLAQRPSMLTTAQFAMNPGSFSYLPELAVPQARGLFMVANHPFGGPAGVGELKLLIAALQSDVSLPADLRGKLAEDISEIMPELVFGCILQGTGISAVVAAMMSLPNLRRNIHAIERCRFTAEELSLLRPRLAGIQKRVA